MFVCTVVDLRVYPRVARRITPPGPFRASAPARFASWTVALGLALLGALRPCLAVTRQQEATRVAKELIFVGRIELRNTSSGRYRVGGAGRIEMGGGGGGKLCTF